MLIYLVISFYFWFVTISLSLFLQTIVPMHARLYRCFWEISSENHQPKSENVALSNELAHGNSVITHFVADLQKPAAMAPSDQDPAFN